MSPHAQGILIALAAAPAYGMSAIFGKYALADGASPLGILLGRFIVAVALLALMVVLLQRRWPSRGSLGKLIAIGAIGQGGMAFCFFSALEHASAGLTGLLLYLHPALVALVEVMLRWERMYPVKLIAIALAMVGCVFTVGGGGGSALGIAYGIAAALVLTGYMLALKRWVVHDGDAIASSTVMMGGTAMLFAVASILYPPSLPAGLIGWSSIVAIAVVSTVLGTTLLLFALARLPASDVSTVMTIEPVFTVIVGWILLGERITFLQFVGGLLIVASVVLLARAAARRVPRAATA